MCTPLLPQAYLESSQCPYKYKFHIQAWLSVPAEFDSFHINHFFPLTVNAPKEKVSPTYTCLVFDQILLEPSVIVYVNPAAMPPQFIAVEDEGYR